MTHEDEKKILEELKKELVELEGSATINKDRYKLDWLMYKEKPYQIDKNALLSKIFIAEQTIAMTEENLRFRKEVKRVGVVIRVLERLERIAIKKNSKIATLISKELKEREWENKEGHPYKLKFEDNPNYWKENK